MKFLTMLLIGLGLAIQASAQHLDGAWLADASYGSKGDKVVGEVLKQINDYKIARDRAEAIQAGHEDGDLREAQQACVDTAQYSWVQANYLAEMGRMSAVAGKTEQAISDYKLALAAAEIAETVDCNEEAKTKKSHEQALIIKKVIKRALKRLGVAD